MSRGGTHESSRKALGSIKDTTTVELAKVNSDYKELEIVIVKFTNHVERPTKKKHVRDIFAAISATKSRADVAYYIHALTRRLSKKHNWVFACSKLPISQMGVEKENGTPGNILPAIEQKISEELEMKVKKYLRGANLEVLQDKKLKRQLAAREELYGKSAKATAKAEKTS